MTLLTLTIRSSNGEIALAKYLDAEPGRGMEPYDPHFTNKVFAHSLLKPGATLALEDLQLKEQIFPVKLHAKSKPALHELIEELNMIINTPGAQVEWQDEGASKPTYFDLVSGQFDDEYEFHMATQNWLKGKLRLFSQPLGYWSKEGARAVMVSGVATTVKVGTTPVVTFNASGSFLGDAPALVQAQVNEPGLELGVPAVSAPKAYAALSVLPSAEYTPWVPVPSGFGYGYIPSASPSFLASAEAPGGTAAKWVKPEGSNNPVSGFAHLRFQASAAKYSYVGEQRLLLAARMPAGATQVEVGGFNVSGGYWAGAPGNIVVGTTSWALYDLGVIHNASSAFGHGGIYEWWVSLNGQGRASSAIEIAGVVQFPEISTTWLNTNTMGGIPVNASPAGHIGWDGLGNAIQIGGELGVPASGIAPNPLAGIVDVSQFVRGVIPQVPAATQSPVLAVLAVNAFGNMNKSMQLAVNVLERCRYAFP